MWSSAQLRELVPEILAGLGHERAELVRLAPNLLYRDGPLAIRISHPQHRQLAEIETEARLLGWLAERDFPALHLAAEPELITGCPVLLTTWIECGLPVGDQADERFWLQFGRLARRLHELPVPAFLPVAAPPLQLIERQSMLVERGLLSEAEAAALSELSQRALALCPGSRLEAGQRELLLHGDLHPGNCRLSEAGELILIDWEHAARGPSVYDFSSIASLPAFYGLDRHSYLQFCRGYGAELAADSLCRALVVLRVLAGISYLLLCGPEERREGRRRLERVLDGRLCVCAV